jgi:uncharacterized protein with FMN-binding domain
MATERGDPPADSDEAEDEVTFEREITTTTGAVVAGEDTGGSFSVVGSEEDSRYGTFQVEVFFESGRIVAVESLRLPTDNKSNAINNSAVPAYESAVIAAHSADIEVISSATVTWENCTDSLQSALDEAGFIAWEASVAGPTVLAG